jgi:hypothetical protein
MTSNESQGDSYVLPKPHAVAESAHQSRKILKQNERRKMNIEKIHEHYEHAKAKHPYFCDLQDLTAAKSECFASTRWQKII